MSQPREAINAGIAITISPNAAVAVSSDVPTVSLGNFMYFTKSI